MRLFFFKNKDFPRIIGDFTEKELNLQRYYKNPPSMNEYCIYLKLKPFVRQWLVNAFGEPVVFPAQSIENATIRLFVMQLPKDRQPDVKTEDATAIKIPDSSTKPSRLFNYMSPRGKMAVTDCIETLFNRNLWAELGNLSAVGCNTMSAIYAWCDNHGIDLDYSDTVRQRYYRMRDAYTKKGIDLRKKSRNKQTF